MILANRRRIVQFSQIWAYILGAGSTLTHHPPVPACKYTNTCHVTSISVTAIRNVAMFCCGAEYVLLPASEPAFGLRFRPKAPRTSPEHSFGSRSCCCSSEPNRKIGCVPSEVWAHRVMAGSVGPPRSAPRRRSRTMKRGSPGAAHGFGEGDAPPTQLGHLGHQLVGEGLGAIQLLGRGRDLLGGELPHRALQEAGLTMAVALSDPSSFPMGARGGESRWRPGVQASTGSVALVAGQWPGKTAV